MGIPKIESWADWMCPSPGAVVVAETSQLTGEQLQWLLTAIVVVVVIFAWYSISYRLHRLEKALNKHVRLDSVVLSTMRRKEEEESVSKGDNG